MTMDERMAALGAAFAARAAGDLGAIRAAIDADPMNRDEARRIAHRFAGAAGLFGFPALSDAASALEQAIDEGADDQTLGALLAKMDAAAKG